jgi:hypothetical protein
MRPVPQVSLASFARLGDVPRAAGSLASYVRLESSARSGRARVHSCRISAQLERASQFSDRIVNDGDNVEERRFSAA